MSPQLSQLLKQIKTSEVTGLMPARDDEQMRGFFPLSMQISGCQPHPQWGFATLPRASCSPGHQSRYPEGTHTAQAGIQVRTQPSPQSLHPGNSDTQEGKLPFEFLLDVVQLLIRRKWQNKHSFASNLEKHLSPTKLLANKLNNNIPFWLRGPHGWHDRAIYSNIYMIPKLVQDNEEINFGNRRAI